MLKRILNIAIWLLLFSGLIVTLGFVNQEQGASPCRAIDIAIGHETDNNFIDESDVKTIVCDKGNALVGHPLSTLNINQMEKVIRNNPFVENAEVYETINGIVKIDVKQRKPLLRIFNSHDESFYVDENGTYMPLSEKYSAPVMVATGYIKERFRIHTLKINPAQEDQDTTYHKTIIDDLFLLAKHIDTDELLKSLIVQVYVNQEGLIELTPRIGNYQIVLGTIDNMKEKLKNLIVVYKKGLSKTGWDQYESIDLQYKNQVICTKIKTQQTQ
jgi:cell division protein FtsQ